MATSSFSIPSRSGSRIFLFLIFLLAASPGYSAVTVLNYWRMGENDSTVQAGQGCVVTADAVHGTGLTNTNSGGIFPLFTSDIAVAAVVNTGSSLSVAYTNTQYGTAALVTSAKDNFGMECWVKPGTSTSGGHVLVHNGLRGNGWGLYQNGASFEVLYGGQIFFGSAPATPNAWTHLALVRSGGVAILYTNGIPAATNSSNTPLTPTGSFTVCGNASFGEYFTGLIDEVRVFTFTAGAFSTNDLLLNSNKVVVFSANDSGPGSLRSAAASATNGTVITFNPVLAGQLITLTNGSITVNSNLTIDASAIGGVQISGNASSRIFTINSNVTATLNSLTLINGRDFGGGAISNGTLATLTVNGCTFTGNQSSGSLGGGAIVNLSTLTVNGCSFTGNQAVAPFGGAIFDTSGSSSTVINCTFTANQAASSGGGICSFGPLVVHTCTFAGNQALAGGGVFEANSSLRVNNSTFTGNQAGVNPSFSQGGGGICIDLTTMILNDCTIAGNQANGSTGGGILSTSSTLNLTNCIVAGNSPDDSPSGDHCLINTSTLLLAPLGNYGGPTQTMPPLPGSPAIDAGNDSITSFLTTDQRGSQRQFGAHVDIGAVESGGLWVTNINDSVAGSLRTVAAGATSTTSAKTVLFAPSLSGQTITLTSGAIFLSNNLTIDASALTNGIQISGNNNSPVFQVNGGAVVALNALTLTHGNGGGVDNSGNLTLSNCTLTANQAGNVGAGGGIFNASILTVNNCTLSGNLANNNSFGGGGGGLYNQGTVTINNSTFSGNQANNDVSGGGGIANIGTLIINSSTLSLNQAIGSSGGGILNSGGTVFMTNSIVAGNFPDDAPGGFRCLVNTSPALASLGNYGGPTQTMPPLPGSPVIDAGVASALTIDQRGFARVVGLAADIGAVEGIYNSAGPGKLTNFTRLSNGVFELAFTNFTDQSYSVDAATNLGKSSANWTRIGYPTESPSGSGKYQFIDVNATNFSRRFYRISSP